MTLSESTAAGDEAVKAVLGEERFAVVQKTKLLVVGAGGIGCELLKNLVLTGFRDIEAGGNCNLQCLAQVVDLDTIDADAPALNH